MQSWEVGSENEDDDDAEREEEWEFYHSSQCKAVSVAACSQDIEVLTQTKYYRLLMSNELNHQTKPNHLTKCL